MRMHTLSGLALALGAMLAEAGAAGAAPLGPVPGLTAADSAATPVRMKKRSMARRGGTISTKLGTKTR